MTNIEAFAHIIDLANRTTDTATYEYLMREAQEIMRDKKTEDILYCDLAAFLGAGICTAENRHSTLAPPVYFLSGSTQAESSEILHDIVHRANPCFVNIN